MFVASSLRLNGSIDIAHAWQAIFAKTKKEPRIFSTDSAKAIKSQGVGYLNAIMYMAPHRSGLMSGTICSHSNVYCEELCLGKYSGQASMVKDLENGTNSVRASRALKAQLFMGNPIAYARLVMIEIHKLIKTARKLGLLLCVRLNGSQDIAWERIKIDGLTIFEHFPLVQFVDYTKNHTRMNHGIPNYHLTLSYSGTNLVECIRALRSGHNVAVIFGSKTMPAVWAGHPVINGDETDLRHLDPRGYAQGRVVGLSPKGPKAKRTNSPFIVRHHSA